MVGFVQKIGGDGTLEAHKVQCFYGTQTKKYDIQHSTEELNEDGSKIAKIDQVKPLPDLNKKSVAQTDAPPDEEQVQLKEQV